MILATDKLFYDARVLREATALVNSGLNVTVVTMDSANLNGIDQLRGIKLRKLALWSRRLPRGRFLWVKYLEFSARALIAVARSGALWIHCHDLPTLPVGALLARVSRRKLIYDSHEIWTGLSLSRPMRAVWAFVERACIMKCDSVITTDQFRAEWLVERYGLPVVHVVMNTPEAPTHTSNRSLRLETSARDGDLIGVYFGELQPGRHIEEIILAARYLKNEVHIAIVGMCGADYRRHIQALVAQSGGRVKLLDPVPPSELISYISAADFAFIFYEPVNLNNLLCSPNKLFECLIAGLPIIAGSNPLLRQVVSDESVGLVVPDAVTPQAIAEAIGTIVQEEHLKCFRDACSTAAPKYTWDAQCRTLLQVYCRP